MSDLFVRLPMSYLNRDDHVTPVSSSATHQTAMAFAGACTLGGAHMQLGLINARCSFALKPSGK